MRGHRHGITEAQSGDDRASTAGSAVRKFHLLFNGSKLILPNLLCLRASVVNFNLGFRLLQERRRGIEKLHGESAGVEISTIDGEVKIFRHAVILWQQ